MSYFSQRFINGLKENAIKYIESGKQGIPDDLALALEKEYKISFRWWKTGEGSMLIEEGERKGMPNKTAENIKEINDKSKDD